VLGPGANSGLPAHPERQVDRPGTGRAEAAGGRPEGGEYPCLGSPQGVEQADLFVVTP